MNETNVSPEQSYAEPRTLPHPVRFFRLALGLTRAELAERAGVHFNTVSNVELRRNLPTLRTARKISAGLGLPVAEVFPEFKGWDR